MAEYIEREALLKRLKFKAETDTTYHHLKQRGLESAMAQVRKAPFADVAPVVHAKWEQMKVFNTQYVCSACGDLFPDYRSNYCPNCGARMDGE